MSPRGNTWSFIEAAPPASPDGPDIPRSASNDTDPAISSWGAPAGPSQLARGPYGRCPRVYLPHVGCSAVRPEIEKILNEHVWSSHPSDFSVNWMRAVDRVEFGKAPWCGHLRGILCLRNSLFAYKVDITYSSSTFC
jgi:hypothetical protein